MLTFLLGALILTMWRYPDWIVSQLLHRWAVIPLARRLNAITRQHLIFGLIMLIIMLTAGEFIASLGPLDMGLVLMWDVAGFVDAMVAATTVLVLARGQGFGRWLRAIVQSRARPRQPRSTVKRQTPSRGANDGDGPALAVAA